MDNVAFAESLARVAHKGTVFKNPGGGTTTIVSEPRSVLIYRRARSTFRVPISELHRAYLEFRGRKVSTADLKAFAPGIFNTKEDGHDCHCTTLFLLLHAMDLSGPVHGKGVRGDPFWVKLGE